MSTFDALRSFQMKGILKCVSYEGEAKNCQLGVEGNSQRKESLIWVSAYLKVTACSLPFVEKMGHSWIVFLKSLSEW